MATQQAFSSIPDDGVEFELTIGAIDPMEMVRSDGYYAVGWKFTGALIPPRTGRFKLVHLHLCRYLNEVTEKLKAYGAIPAGQWREAFKMTYPRNDGGGPIGFPNPSWSDKAGWFFFPALEAKDEGWKSYLYQENYGFRGGQWRWLVEVK